MDGEPERVDVDGMELHLKAPSEPDGRALDDPGHTALPPKVDSWRRRSALGAMLTGIALGLKEALEPRRDEPAVIMEVSGEPVEDLPVEAHLDQFLPQKSVIGIRPWLLDDDLIESQGPPDAERPPDNQST